MSEQQTKPTPKHNRVERHDGCYNLCAPSEVSAQFLFRLREDSPFPSRMFGASVSLKQASAIDVRDGALAVAMAVHSEHKKCIYSSVLPDLEKLIAYLESVEAQDVEDELRHDLAVAEWELEQAEAERDRCQRYLNSHLAERIVTGAQAAIVAAVEGGK